MDKPAIDEFNITESQYLKYKEYRVLVEKRKERLNSIEDGWISFIVGYLFVLCFFIYMDWDSLSSIYYSEEYLRLFGVVLVILVISIIVFPLTLGLTAVLNLIFLNKIIRYIATLFIKEPKRNDYFINAEKFEQKEKEYEEYINNLEQKYPNISKYNYSISLYFKDVINDVIEYEKKYINEIINKRKEKKQSEYWLSLDGYTFEREIAKLYYGLGYKAKVTKASGDGGIDIKLWRDDEYIIVQCKNHKNPIGPSVIRDLYGVMHKEKADKVILICSGGFNRGVYDFSNGLPIELLSIKDVISLSNKVYIDEFKSVTEVYTVYCANTEIIFVFKKVGDIYILYSSYEKALLYKIANKIEYVNQYHNGYYLFDNIEDAKRICENISIQLHKPLDTDCYYDIANMIIPFENYKRKNFYYIRMIRKDQLYFKSKNAYEYSK
jgi:restriction system protein